MVHDDIDVVADSGKGVFERFFLWQIFVLNANTQQIFALAQTQYRRVGLETFLLLGREEREQNVGDLVFFGDAGQDDLC